MTVAVVGAGLAGLAAAVRLQANGVSVRVFDPAPPGGKARTLEPLPGWRVEWGPHSLTHRATAVFQLADELGIGDRLEKLGENARARYLVRGGRLLPAPLRALRLGEWFSALRGLFRRVPDVPGESVRDWVVRRFGAALAEGPVDAMMNGIWASDPAAIEMDAAFPNLAALVRREGTLFRALRAFEAEKTGRARGTWGFPNGIGAIGDAARERLGDAIVPRAVLGIERGFVVRTEEGAERFDAVVVATEAPAAARLLVEVAPEAVGPLSEIRYAPLAVAHWLTKDAALPAGFGFLAAHAEKRPVLGTIFVSDLFPGRVPDGHRSFATMLGGSRRPEDAAVDEAEARRRVEAEHLALTGKPVTFAGFHLVHHPAAVAPPAPGHARRMKVLHDALPPGLTVAGAWCGGGAMDDAVRAGQVAAETILRSSNVG